MSEAELARVAIYAEISEHTADFLQIKKEINLAKQTQVIALHKLFVGAEIGIGQKLFEIKHDRERGVFKLGDSGGVVFI